MGETTADPLVGHVLEGRYRVTRRLARGGMATVYEAMDTRLERVVAVKVMHPGLAEDRDFVERFIREARAAARLSHPNVVAVFDQSDHAGHVFLAMEYVEGRTLRDWLREKGRLTPRETFAVMEPVLAALAAAHAAGLVHRDIKPENVLIADDGRVKVADFGLARAVSAGTSTVTHVGTGAGTLIGTVAYLSPEQVERGVADHRSDVYAAGILLYECLTGLQPFSGETPIQVAYQHVHYDVPRPSDQRPTLPPSLDDLVLRATAREPAGRPSDAGVFLAEMVVARRALRAEVLDDLAGLAGPGGPTPTAAPREGSPTLRLGDLGLAAMGAGPHDATAQIPRGAAPPPRGPGGPAPRGAVPPGDALTYPVPPRLAHRRRRGVIALVLVVLAAFGVGIGAWQVAAGSSVTTPPLLNLTRAAAEAKAKEAGLQIRFDKDEFDEIVPKGQVLRTDPAPGRKVAENGTIRAVLSAGPERYTVPDLKNVDRDEAEQRLTEANFTVGDKPTSKFSSDIAEGKVLGTSPPADTKLKRDAVVTLILSKGPKPVQLPDVTGKQIEEAEALLKQLGFEVERVDEETDEAPNGVVLEQSPAGNRKIGQGSTVELTVAKSDLVAVPRVIGMDLDDAEEYLESLGFEVDSQGGFFSSRVADQDPPPGTRLPYGSTVRIRAGF